MKLKDFLKPTSEKIIILFAIIVILSSILRLVFGTIPFMMPLTTNSMQPTYSRGDLLFIKKTDFNSLKVGDIIVHQLSPTMTVITGENYLARRIVSIDYNEEILITERNLDSTQIRVKINEVHGKVVFSVPLFGYLLIYNILWLFTMVVFYPIACLVYSIIGTRKIPDRP